MRSSKSGNYFDYQHCWTRFTCPDNRHAEYKIAAEFYLESGYDYLRFYEVNNGDLTTVGGEFSSTGRWISLADSYISIEFRTDGSNVGIGFDMEIRCMPN